MSCMLLEESKARRSFFPNIVIFYMQKFYSLCREAFNQAKIFLCNLKVVWASLMTHSFKFYIVG